MPRGERTTSDRRRADRGPAVSDARAVVERTFRAESGRALATLARLLGDVGRRRGRGAGGVRRGAADLARTGRSRPAGRLDHDHRPQPRPRPGAARGAAPPTGRPPRAARPRRRARTPRHRRPPGPPTGTWSEDGEVVPVADDQLRMMFTCCHPALAPAAQVALTLRLVCGLRTDEIARAFLQPEATVAQRLSRAKAKIRATKIPFRVPPGRLLAERLPAVLACVYLVFSEGYAATGRDDLIRHELCDEGIRLARLVAELLPDEPEAHGLLALVLLQDSRRAARLRPRGRDGPAGGPGPRPLGPGPHRRGPGRARPGAGHRSGGPVPAAGHHRRRARQRARRGPPPTGPASPRCTPCSPGGRRRPWSS